MIKQKYAALVEAQLKKIVSEQNVDISLEIPKNSDHGDYSTPISFSLAKQLKKSPKHIADELTEQLNESAAKKGINYTAINGFINLRFSDTLLWKEFVALHQATHSFPKHSDKILLEYVSANPTGPLHIGHGRWAVYGSAIHALLTYIGWTIASEFYINDAGNQITLFHDSIQARKNNTPIPEGGYHGDYITALTEEKDPLKAVLQHQEKILKSMGVSFDHWFSESTLYNNKAVEHTLEKLNKKQLTYEKEGALWFRSTDFGDTKDRVLIKADGAYTYFVVDIAYHLDKVNRGYTELINIWGADHHGYIQRVRAALIAIVGDTYATNAKFRVLIGQMVSLFRNQEPVRMSKRTGDMITLEDVITDIGADATRYFLLEKSAETHLEFDLELAKKKTAENPVYYIQYAHARISSILKKLSEESSPSITEPSQISLNPYERKLMSHCLHLYDEIYDAATNFSPHKLTAYLLRLAKLFHLFYEHCPVMKASPEDQCKRAVILKEVKETIRVVLHLLGISSPERM